MKIIFLDVDGVLSHQVSITASKGCREPFDSSFYYARQCDPACVARLKRVLDATGAKIVVSSVWRRFDKQSTGLRRALHTAGVHRRVIVGSTPYLALDGTKGRATEIDVWLSKHPEVTSYLVIDDNWIGHHPQLPKPPSHSGGGLLDCHADDAIAILGTLSTG